MIPALADGKINLVEPRIAVSLSERRSENIEARPNTVEHSTSLSIDEPRYGSPLSKFYCLATSPRIYLLNNEAWLSFDPCMNLPFKARKFGNGPIDRSLSIQ